MQFIDLKAQYLALKDEIDANIQSVLNRTAFILGDEVKTLESCLAAYTGRKHCVSCANGTDALSLAMSILKIGSGDAVFVPAFTFFASAETVTKAGAQAVFVDIDSDTFNIDAKSLEDKIVEVLKDGRFAPKAIVAVDLFGMPADFNAVKKVAKKYGLKIIEDGAQGFGGTFGGARACSFGDVSTTSFFPAKPLGCYGDGGAIFVDDDSFDALLRSLRFHGKGADKYDNVRIGCNSRLDNIQAAVLLAKLSAFENSELDARHSVAKVYDTELGGVCKTPVIPDGFTSSYAQYTLTLSDAAERDALKDCLVAKKIPSMIYYPRCMHQLKAYDDYPFKQELPNAEASSLRVLSLPMHPYLKSDEQFEVCGAIKEFFGK